MLSIFYMFKCTIDSHIPNEEGTRCECGYFRKDKLNVYDAISFTKSINITIDKAQQTLQKILNI